MTELDVAMDVDKLMEEYDIETSKSRKLTGIIGTITAVIAILMSIFQFYTAGFGTLLSAKQRALHIIFAFTLGFLLFPGGKKSKKDKASVLDYIFILLVVIVFGYLFVFVNEIATRGGNATTVNILFWRIGNITYFRNHKKSCRTRASNSSHIVPLICKAWSIFTRNINT